MWRGRVKWERVVGWLEEAGEGAWIGARKRLGVVGEGKDLGVVKEGVDIVERRVEGLKEN